MGARAGGIAALMMVTVAGSGCAGMTRNQRAATAGLSGAGSLALGVLLVTSRSGCSGASEDPDACTFADHGRDAAVTIGGGLAIAGGVALLVAMAYVLAH